MEAAKETREKLREMREELATKEALQARLQDEHSKLAKTVSRWEIWQSSWQESGNICDIRPVNQIALSFLPSVQLSILK